MHGLSIILEWASLFAGLVALVISATAFIKNRGLTSAFLFDGVLLIWLHLVLSKWGNLEAVASNWLKWSGELLIAAFAALRPWRVLQDNYKRLFNVSLAGALVIFVFLFVHLQVILMTATPDRDIPRWMSFLLDMRGTFTAVAAIFMAAVSYLWLLTRSTDKQKGTPENETS